MQEEKITVGTFDLGAMTEKAATLYGMSGGQLEFMGLRFVTRKEHNGLRDIWRKYVILTFTDHDLQALPDEAFRDTGLKPTYELMFPVE